MRTNAKMGIKLRSIRYLGLYREKRGGEVNYSISHISHTSKNSFALMLRRKGYRVVAVLDTRNISDIADGSDNVRFSYSQEIRDYVNKMINDGELII